METAAGRSRAELTKLPLSWFIPYAVILAVQSGPLQLTPSSPVVQVEGYKILPDDSRRMVASAADTRRWNG